MFDGAEQFPVDHALDEVHCQGEPIWTGTLEPGDVLYVPRGAVHDVANGPKPSLHITIGIRCYTGMDLIDLLKQAANSSIAFRENLPPFKPDREHGAHLQKLADELRQLMVNFTYENIQEHAQARVTARPLISFPWLGATLTAEDLKLEPFVLSPQVTFSPVDSRIVVKSKGRRWGLHPGYSVALKKLATRPTTFSEFHRVCAGKGLAEECLEVFSQLVDEGLICATEKISPVDAL